jgi:hypothetical protein
MARPDLQRVERLAIRQEHSGHRNRAGGPHALIASYVSKAAGDAATTTFTATEPALRMDWPGFGVSSGC